MSSETIAHTSLQEATGNPENQQPITLSLYHLKRVQDRVSHHLPNYYDREQIALDILIESWLNGQPLPTFDFIKHRCIDVARLKQRESQIMNDLSHRTHSTTHEPTTDARERVAKLIRCLNPQEKQAIAYRFYMDLPVAEAAQQCRMPEDTFRVLIQRCLHKMREASV